MQTHRSRQAHGWTRVILASLVLSAAWLVGGCEQKEKVLDIETPGGGIEINRTRDTGEIEIETENR